MRSWPSNDIEFSGERKRVRCNALLDGVLGRPPRSGALFRVLGGRCLREELDVENREVRTPPVYVHVIVGVPQRHFLVLLDGHVARLLEVIVVYRGRVVQERRPRAILAAGELLPELRAGLRRDRYFHIGDRLALSVRDLARNAPLSLGGDRRRWKEEQGEKSAGQSARDAVLLHRNLQS